MALIPGTIPVTGTFAPTDTIDTFAIMDMTYILDGWRNVANKTERNAVTDERRKEGMIVGTQDTSEYWRLLAAPWTGTDTDWELFIGGDGASSLDALDDVTLVSPIMDGDILVYNISTGQWENAEISNIYTIDGILSGNRIVSGGISNNSISFNDLTSFYAESTHTGDSHSMLLTNNFFGLDFGGGGFAEGSKVHVIGNASGPEIKIYTHVGGASAQTSRLIFPDANASHLWNVPDESGILLVGPAFDTLIANPTVTEDGFSITWNNTNKSMVTNTGI